MDALKCRRNLIRMQALPQEEELVFTQPRTYGQLCRDALQLMVERIPTPYYVHILPL